MERENGLPRRNFLHNTECYPFEYVSKTTEIPYVLTVCIRGMNINRMHIATSLVPRSLVLNVENYCTARMTHPFLQHNFNIIINIR